MVFRIAVREVESWLMADQASFVRYFSVSDSTPIHPGEHLAEILAELGISQYRLAKAIGVAPRRINEIVHGRRSRTADTALRIPHHSHLRGGSGGLVAVRHAPHREPDRAGGRPQLPVVGQKLVDLVVASLIDVERTCQVNSIQRADDRWEGLACPG